MRNSTILFALTLAAALVALGNAVVIESASAQARPPPAGSAARPAKKPGSAPQHRSTAASATTARPGRAPSVYRSAPTQRHAVANQARVTQRVAGGRAAAGDTRRHGVNLGSTSPLNWATWNRATRPATATVAPQRARQSRSGRTVTFREHRSTAASASTVRPGRPPSVYRSAPTQRRAVANQARATQRAGSGRAAVGDGRRNAVNLGTASPVNTWSGWNRAANALAPAANASRTRQSGGGRRVTFREARASVELPRLRRDASGNIIAP